jgi:hypothetical protein
MKIVLSFLLVAVWSLSFSFAANAQQTNDPAHGIQKQPSSSPPSIEVIVTDNRIKVVNAPTGSRLEIYSVVGVKVVEIELKQPNGEYVVNIAKGYYIARIGETVRKVAIR